MHRRIVLVVKKSSIACSLLKKRIAMRKVRVDRTFVGDLIDYVGAWFQVETDVKLNAFGNKVITCKCFMTGSVANMGAVIKIPIEFKVRVLKHKYKWWKRTLLRIVR